MFLNLGNQNENPSQVFHGFKQVQPERKVGCTIIGLPWGFVSVVLVRWRTLRSFRAQVGKFCICGYCEKQRSALGIPSNSYE